MNVKFYVVTFSGYTSSGALKGYEESGVSYNSFREAMAMGKLVLKTSRHTTCAQVVSENDKGHRSLMFTLSK